MNVKFTKEQQKFIQDKICEALNSAFSDFGEDWFVFEIVAGASNESKLKVIDYE
jgi:hypothetical protein